MESERGVWAGGPAPEPTWFRTCQSRGWDPESGVVIFLPLVVALLGLGLVALFGALPLWLLGLASLLVCAHALASGAL